MEATMQQIKANNIAFEDKQYSIEIDCPEHTGKHKATLHQYPHRYAGIWECPTTGASDMHECEEFYDDTATSDHLGTQGHYQNETAIKVCADCEVACE